ncbi:class IV adenylate cyclase [Paractinoplanes globisporus]|uniref:Class IV adenylate cyclase n=1 Tax=Paractinoplanes globisporus TaxID=113565 RepID=A0ABW6WG52_9ACTN|nr:class IV adenylate cyclase [Actinoplanes globisporus]
MSGEAEVKFRVLDLDALMATLQRCGVTLSAPVRQEDQAYAPSGWSPGQSRIGVTFARLRLQDGVCLFTTKTPVDNVLACLEHETVVDDRDQMHLAVLAMGYRPTVQVAKTRRVGRSGAYALCVDEVDGAGIFLEVEAMTTAVADMAALQTELAEWVKGLDVPLEPVGATYDQLVTQARA